MGGKSTRFTIIGGDKEWEYVSSPYDWRSLSKQFNEDTCIIEINRWSGDKIAVVWDFGKFGLMDRMKYKIP